MNARTDLPSAAPGETDPYIAMLASSARHLLDTTIGWRLDLLRVDAGLARVATEDDDQALTRMVHCRRACTERGHFHEIIDLPFRPARCDLHPWTRLDARGCVTCRVLAVYPVDHEEGTDDGDE